MAGFATLFIVLGFILIGYLIVLTILIPVFISNISKNTDRMLEELKLIRGITPEEIKKQAPTKFW